MSKTYLVASSSSDFIENFIINLKKELYIHSASADYIEIKTYEGKQSIGIESARKLISWLTLKPFNSENKLSVIHEANKLTIEAQNSLLKVLEEPNPNNYIVLTLENAEGILPTVLSRCEIIKDFSMQDDKIGNFYKLSKTDQFLLIEKILKGKDPSEINNKIKNLLTELAKYFENLILSGNINKDITDDISLITQTSIMINANVSKRLALENLLINLKCC